MGKVVEVKNLKKYFNTANGFLHAVDNVSLSIENGKTLGVVGESGCGKSTLGRTLIRLLDSTSGSILLEGKDITSVKGRELAQVRERAQIIFQDPYSSLNPRMCVRKIISEPMVVSGKFSKSEIEERTDFVMKQVGIESRLYNAYPHELDGGRRQRVGIGRALILEPAFIVCDEPVSALDVSIQAQILNLLKELQLEKKLTYMFITHDLSVVRHISDTICVMYLGEVVELCPSKELFKTPLHPYTKALLSAIPSIDITKPQERFSLKGELSSPINPKPGCRFASRCPYAQERCSEPQVQVEIEQDHFVSCCRAKELG